MPTFSVIMSRGKNAQGIVLFWAGETHDILPENLRALFTDQSWVETDHLLLAKSLLPTPGIVVLN